MSDYVHLDVLVATMSVYRWRERWRELRIHITWVAGRTANIFSVALFGQSE